MTNKVSFVPALNYFNYFTEIEETFIRRRGKHLLLSPLDWSLIESWKEQGIPLRIVLRGIENVFDGIEKNPNRSKSIKSLTYCRQEIEDLYEKWSESQIGKSEQSSESARSVDSEAATQPELFSEPAFESRLDELLVELEGVAGRTEGDLSQTLKNVSAKLRVHSFKDEETLERELDRLETSIDEVLMNTSDSETLGEIKRDIKSSLEKHEDSMDEGVYQRTFELMLLKRLREDAGIPRLSLFNL